MLSLRSIIITCVLGIVLLSSCSSKRKVAARSESASNLSSSVTSKYATRLGVAPTNLKNEQLYRFVDEWEGTPYKYGGTSKSGVDCSGFVGELYQEVYHKQLPRTTSEIEKGTKQISANQLEEGDIVIFNIDGKKSSHVGVYLQNNYFVHASSSKGVMISNLESSYYQKAFDRGGRW